MATRAFTMSNSVPSTQRKSGFTRRLFVLLAFVLGVVFWTYLILQNQHIVSKDLMSIIAIVMVALSAGLGARLLFYTRNWFIRLIAAWASLILGLFLLGYLTHWKMGFGPIEFWRKTYDWMELAQLGGGMLLVVVALMVWWHGPAAQPVTRKPKRSRPAKKRVEQQAERPREQRPVERAREQPRAVTPRATTSSKPASLFSFPRRSRSEPKPLRLKVSKQARAITRSRPQAEKVVIGRLTKKVRPSRLRKLFQRTPELQISTHEEHRCPFCLEDVKRNDPRGVKECSVCHTLHHADCWDITGMCQVPHLNS
jgi:ribosomal protein L37AE/L43A